MRPTPASSSIATLALAIVAFASLFAIGCTPGVGSPCTLSTDCGTTGNLVCDTSEFQGYCTIQGCVPNECPNSASCVLFNPQIPGCGYNDRQQGSRVDDQFCMATCGSNSDCRDGYECVTPTQLMSAPWNALILDRDQSASVCIPMPLEPDAGGSTSAFDPDAAVCQAVGPAFDAGWAAFDSGLTLPEASFEPDAASESEAPESGADASDSGGADAGD